MIKLFTLSLLRFFDYFHKRLILRALKNFLKNKDNVIFDVGAHHGETILFIKKNFSCAKFFAFEPLKINYEKLLKKTFLFKENLYYFNVGLGDRKEIKVIKQMLETSSSTFSELDESSKYFIRKKFYLGLGRDENMYKKKKVYIEKATNIIKNYGLKKINLLKIDTEGYELNVIKGFGKDIRKVEVILFEHHYDLMLKKKYKFSDINNLLKKHNFLLKYKFKMPFRKTFEYIYINRNI